jgi:hypothetical protein
MAKGENKGVSSVHKQKAFDLLFVDGKATNDEIRAVADLKLVRSMF